MGIEKKKRFTVTVVVVYVGAASFGFASRRFAAAFFAAADGDRPGSTRFDGSGPSSSRMLFRDATRQLLGAPPAGHASSAGRSVVVQLVPTIAFVHDLPIVGDFFDVGTVIVIAHIAHQHDFPVGDVARKRTINWAGRAKTKK